MLHRNRETNKKGGEKITNEWAKRIHNALMAPDSEKTDLLELRPLGGRPMSVRDHLTAPPRGS